MEKTVVSFTLEQDKVELFESYYSGFVVENNNPYVLHAYKVDGVSIMLYSSLKVVLQGKNCVNEALIWGYKEVTWDIEYDHAGSDEVGTGDYFGPVVVAACYVRKDQWDELIKLGINDSKKLSDDFILNTVPYLLDKYPYSVLILDNKKYNEVVETNNMNAIKAKMHNSALNHVTNKAHNVKHYVIDQFCSRDNYYKYIENEENVISNVFFTTKGESHSPAVALASMIARYSFLRYIQELEKQFKIDIILGSSEKALECANKIIEEKGLDIAKRLIKLNFKTLKKDML